MFTDFLHSQDFYTLKMEATQSSEMWFLLDPYLQREYSTHISFENVVQLNHFGISAINQNLIQEEIKRTLNSGNACIHSLQSLSSAHPLSKKIKRTL
jgi:hypothetical protein